MSTELQVWTPPGLPTKDEFEIMRSMAILYAKATGVRDCFRQSPENCFLAISVGREIGVPPTLALSKGYVIEGSFGLEADVLGDVVRRNNPGLSWEVVELDDDHCIVEGGTTGGRQHTVTFTFQMAKDAGWTEGRSGLKNQWRPGARQDTMYAKCIRRLVKRTGGLWASIYTVDPDEAVVDNSRPEPAKHEPSVATVVETPAASAPSTPSAAPQGAVVVPEVPEDWKGRLLNAIADHYMIAARPATTAQGRGRWARQHADEIVRVCNLCFEERGEKPIPGLAMLSPSDTKIIAEWLEARNQKRAGSERPEAAVVQDDPPAQPQSSGAPPEIDVKPSVDAAPAPPDDDLPPPEDDEPREAPPLTMAAVESEQQRTSRETLELAAENIDGLVRAIDTTLRPKFKGARRFYNRSERGRYYLSDGDFLKELGYKSSGGGAIQQWLDVVWAKDADRIMLARLIVDERSKP